jgi:hypothetical protein
MSGYYFALACCLALVVFLVVLLRRRRLREKYAITWLVVAIAVCVLGAFPALIESIASAVGVETPSNLIFALALVLLLGVCIQLSVEITELEEETRTLAEELAILRFDVERTAAEISVLASGNTPASVHDFTPATDVPPVGDGQ